MSSVPPGLWSGCFPDVGDGKLCHDRIAKGMQKLKEIGDGVFAHSISMEIYMQEAMVTIHDVFTAVGRMFE